MLKHLTHQKPLIIAGSIIFLILVITIIITAITKPTILPDNQLNVDQSFDDRNTNYISAHPIIKYLPVETTAYKIGYGACADSDFCIIISATPGYYNYAVAKLTTIEGYLNYPIIFENYTNPFNNTFYQFDTKQTLPDGVYNLPNISTEVINNLKSAISAVTTHPYTLNSVNIYSNGNFCGITISADYEIYRLAAVKVDNTWRVASPIALILQSKDAPTLPDELINLVNQL